jgi:hypothetical protein
MTRAKKIEGKGREGAVWAWCMISVALVQPARLCRLQFEIRVNIESRTLNPDSNRGRMWNMALRSRKPCVRDPGQGQGPGELRAGQGRTVLSYSGARLGFALGISSRSSGCSQFSRASSSEARNKGGVADGVTRAGDFVHY